MSDKQRNAEEAGYILSHPLTVRALEDMETALNDALGMVQERDVEGMKHLVMMKKCVRKFKQVFESHINTGKLERETLTRSKPRWWR